MSYNVDIHAASVNVAILLSGERITTALTRLYVNRGRGGGGTLIFSYIRRLGSLFLGVSEK